MAEIGEIKLNKDDVDNAIITLKANEIKLSNIYDNLVEAHNKLAAKWDGKSGKTFLGCSKVIEQNLKVRIEAYQKLVKNLNTTLETFTDKDKNLYKKI